MMTDISQMIDILKYLQNHCTAIVSQNTKDASTNYMNSQQLHRLCSQL